MVKCRDCKHISTRRSDDEVGRCDYPVPMWQTIGAGPIVALSAEHDCPVFEKAEETENG